MKRAPRRTDTATRSERSTGLSQLGQRLALRDRLGIDLPALGHRLVPVLAIALLVLSMGGTWRLAGAAPPTIAETIKAEEPAQPARPPKKSERELTGKVNLNTATEEQLMLLPTVGPAKAERIVVWRKKQGGFRRIADLRRVKGFGYKTFKRLERFLDVKGETTLR